MSVLNFNEGDYLQTKVVEPAIYSSEVSRIDGPNKSTSGKSINYFVYITITDGPYKGKTKTIAISNGTQSSSLLGEMGWFPMSTFLLLAIACGLDDGIPKELTFENDTLLHQPMDVQWGVATVEGRLINTILAFFKAGYAQEAPAF